MHRTRLTFGVVAIVIVAVITAIIATSGGTAKTAGPMVPPASRLSVKQTSLGPTLVDANGRSLYLFGADRRDQSTLSAAGRAVWPPLTAATSPAAGGGVSASAITLIKGASGRSQVAYYGHPLYYYVGDSGPGQTKGQSLNQFAGVWYVLSPAGTAITSAPATPAPAPSTSGSSGYSY
jgi:predicted lipoprotein with Yx(FWY)xxD motif